MTTERNNATSSYGMLLLVVLFWGLNWPIMKIGLDFIPPLFFGAARMAIGSAIFFVILAAMNRLEMPTRGDLRIVLSEGILHMAAPIGLMNLALLSVDAGRSSVLSFTTTLWITPFSVIFLGVRPTARKWLGFVLGMVGILILFSPTEVDWSSPGEVVGNVLLMLAALTWAVAILIARSQTWNLTPLQLVPWQLALSAVCLGIPAFVFESGEQITWAVSLAWILAFNGAIASGFCFWGALIVAKELPSIDASIGFLGVPVAGVIFSAIILGEPITLPLLMGLILIVIGISVVNITEITVDKQKGPSGR